MKRILVLLAVLLLVACGGEADAPAGDLLTVTDGEQAVTYSVSDIEALPATEAAFREVTYVGVRLTTLLEDAGFDPTAIRAVKATASDGFSANYEAALFALPDTIVATATSEGALTEEDGTFRMVLPDQEGKLNVRQLVELTVIR
jgi:DMSO/TMAO reductase YedYZ molybdopterin-dependent catalytic subunit